MFCILKSKFYFCINIERNGIINKLKIKIMTTVAQIVKVIEKEFVSYNIMDLNTFEFIDGFIDLATAKHFAKEWGIKIQGNLAIYKYGNRIK